MKNIIILAFLSIIICSQEVLSQIPCKNIYVWDFTWDDKKQSDITKQITDLFESALTRQSNCIVLQRRDIADLISQEQNEKAILSIGSISNSTENTLKTRGAEVVVFGKFSSDLRSDDIILYLSIENIISKQVHYSNSIIFTSEQFKSYTSQKKIIDDFIAQNSAIRVVNPDPKENDSGTFQYGKKYTVTSITNNPFSFRTRPLTDIERDEKNRCYRENITSEWLKKIDQETYIGYVEDGEDVIFYKTEGKWHYIEQVSTGKKGYISAFFGGLPTLK
jgi:hypothetical protein